VVICLERGADCLHMVQLMPLHPRTRSCLSSFKSRPLYLSGTGLPRLSWNKTCSSNSVCCDAVLPCCILINITACVFQWTDMFVSV